MEVSYDPPGAVAEAFHQDDSFVRGLRGPVGSGKSSSCCMEIFIRALSQEPDRDGIRRSRWAAIRNTYGELKSTTIKTWTDWFQGLQTMRWDTPIISHMHIPDLGDGTGLDLEVMFLALDRPDDAGKLRSLELSGAWLNEASELDKVALDMCTQRVGRYPSRKNGNPGPTWNGVIMDTNPPDDDHWWYKLAEEEKPESFKFFAQPGGLYLVSDKKHKDYGKWVPNPLAENIRNLTGGHQYYLKQLAGKSDDYIKVFLGGQYGTTLHGKPVYPEFNEKLHVADKPLTPIPGLPLVLSFDFGLTPACIFSQMSPKGQWLILREYTSEDMGIRQFYSEVIAPILASDFRNYRVEAVGDPAGENRSQTDAKSCFQELAELGLRCEGANTNEFIKRRESVVFFLQRLTSSGPGMLIDPRCSMVIKGFRGGYRYERLKTSGPAAFKDRPAKDKYSHPHDALQYGALHMRGESTQVVHQEIQTARWA